VIEAAGAGETFTTTSLDAMRAYAAGQAFLDRSQYKEAINEFQRAIGFDSQLGRAYAGMAVAYRNDAQSENARQAYESAFKLIERMTPRERYRTLGGYYFTVHGNYEKAVENYEALITQFPADKVGLANLAFSHLMLGNVQRALVVGKEAMDADPRSPFKRFNYAMYALYNGEFEASREQTPILLKDAPRLFLAWLPAALTSLSLGDIAQARQAYASMATIEDFKDPDVRQGALSLAAIGTADISMYLGRPAEAIADLRAAAEQDVAEKQPDKAAHKYVALGDAYLAMGRSGPATEAARRALSLSSIAAVAYPAARILIQTGEIEEAQEIATDLSNRLQTQTVAYSYLIRGEIALRRNDRFAAIESFREAQKRFDSWFSRYLLGTAYASAERFTEALTEFEACIKRRGEVTDVFFENTPTIRYLPNAYYWLARSQEASGLTTAARENYQVFLNLRTNTDTPDPLAEEAAKRLAQIQ
jgi:tetratricopeptide (TPR) repeat protein